MAASNNKMTTPSKNGIDNVSNEEPKKRETLEKSERLPKVVEQDRLARLIDQSRRQANWQNHPAQSSS